MYLWYLDKFKGITLGMRLPNILHYNKPMEKRRIGMRLPNLIYLKNDNEKKSDGLFKFLQ